VDVKHEVVLAYEITDTKAGDGETLPDVLKQAEANLPAGRIETLAYDKAADSDDVHEHLSDKGITPLIQMRSLWQTEPERMLPGHDGTSNVVYDEAGTIYCYDKVSDPPVRHKMAYIGHEPERETLKYRCPAKHEDWECPMSSVCNAGKSYGKTVRVPREVDPRRFPALPRATKKFERMYKGRTAVERVNARLKVFWGVDDGNLTGSRRFAAEVGVVLAVHAVFATLLASAPRREGTLGKIGLNPIAKALRAKSKAEAVAV
jgi:Transposase DDE domain